MPESKEYPLKKYDLKLQEKENYCFVSVLQAIFDKYGMNISQDIIAKELTPSKKGFKVNDDKVRNYFEFMGFKYEHYFHNGTPLNEPELIFDEIDKKDIIVGWNNHSGLVLGRFPEPSHIPMHIVLKDPYDLSIHIMTLDNLLKKMRKHKGDFGLLEKIN